MRIKCTRRDVWWVVEQRRRGQVFTYSFIWPMVVYWLEDQLGLPPKAPFVQWYAMTKWRNWRE